MRKLSISFSTSADVSTQVVNELTRFIHDDLPLAELVSKYDVLYWDGDEVGKANATDETRMPAFGMALEDGEAGDNIEVLDKGRISNAAWELASGEIIFVDTADGDFTTSAPTNAGNVVQRLGRTLDQDTIFFDSDEMTLNQG